MNYKPLERLFSVKNNNVHKVITIFGLKLNFFSKKQSYLDIKNDVQQNSANLNTKLDNLESVSKNIAQQNSDNLNIVQQNIDNLNIKLDYLELTYKNISKQNNTILYIDWHIFEPDTNAGDRASYSYFKAFLNRSYNVIYLPFLIEQNTKNEYFDLIKDYGVEILTDSSNNINYDYLKAWFQKNGKFINYVFINRPDIYIHYKPLIDKYLSDAKKIYQGHDIHFLRLSRMAEIENQKVDRTEIDLVKEMELTTWKHADTVLYFSEKEIEIVKSYVPDAKALAVPLFLYSNVEKINYNPEYRKDLLFVGGFNHTPNTDAMKWFINDIFPLVLKNNSDIKLHIAGSNCPQDIVATANENVVIHGYLSDEDLQNLYDKTKIVISPLRYGAGVKGKIIEAMKNQIPVITTDIGAEGIKSDSLTIANTEKEFANAILNLYNNNEKLEQISNDSYYYIRDNFSEKFMDNLIEYINNNCNSKISIK